MTLEACTVHRIVAYNILPCKGGYDYVSYLDIFTVYYILHKIKVDWAQVVMYRMFDYASSSTRTTSIGYGMVITCLLESFSIDLCSETDRVSRTANIEYNDQNIKQMHFELQSNRWVSKTTPAIGQAAGGSGGGDGGDSGDGEDDSEDEGGNVLMGGPGMSSGTGSDSLISKFNDLAVNLATLCNDQFARYNASVQAITVNIQWIFIKMDTLQQNQTAVNARLEAKLDSMLPVVDFLNCQYNLP